MKRWWSLFALALTFGGSVAFADDAGVPSDAEGEQPPAPDSLRSSDESAALLPPADRPEIELTVEPQGPVSVGDSVVATLKLTVAEGDEVAVPRQGFGAFELVGRRASEAEAPRNHRTHTFRLDLVALEPGDHTLGPIRLRLVLEDGRLGEAETRTVSLRVKSLLGNEPNAELKPPTKPVRVLEQDYTLAWIAGLIAALLATAGGGFAAARWWMRRPKPSPPPPPPVPAWEIAQAKLEALRADLPRENLVQWSDRLSDALREYLGLRYAFDGLESTTDEVLDAVHRIRPAGLELNDVAAVLQETDLIKFAKASPNTARCEELLQTVEEVVRTTMPSAPGPETA